MKAKDLIEWAKHEKVVPIDTLLQKLGANVDSPAIWAVYKRFGNVRKMLKWSEPGNYRVLTGHDLGTKSVASVRACLQEHYDLIEMVMDEVTVVGTQKEYVEAMWPSNPPPLESPQDRPKTSAGPKPRPKR